MIYSGIDWSEAVKETTRVFAIVHVESQELPILDHELAGVRKRIRRTDNSPFKHVDAKPHVRREFFLAISRIPTLQAFVLTCADLPRGEMPIVTAYRTGLRQGLRIARKPPIRDLCPRPDDRLDAAIVQVADMIAGEVREYGGLNGPHLPALSSRIHIV